MKNYYGTKWVMATPMTLVEYNEYMKFELPTIEEELDGYLVEYIEGGKSNHDNHEGYISWSPKAVFEKSYLSTESMNFSHALEALKKGYIVSRSGWNGKGMGLSLKVPHARSKMTLPYIYMKTADNQKVPWLASQTDLLAEDWKVNF